MSKKQIEAKITYDAKKLAKEMPRMIKKLLTNYTNETGENAKSNIFEGKVEQNLSETTKRIRRKRGQRGTPALNASGRLLRSIKVKQLKDGAKISMNFYGALHNKGYNTAPNSMIPRKKVPKRQFITPKKGAFDRLAKGFGKEIAKQFKKTK